MTSPNRIAKAAVAGLATAALVLAPLSAFATPRLSDAAVTPISQQHIARGSLVSAVQVAQLTAASLDTAAAATGFEGAPQARYGVTAYRLVYRTVDHNGRPTTASGLVVLPNGKHGALTVAEYLHGTMPSKATAPSVDELSPDRLATAMFAGAGLVGISPDYLGLGLGPGKPPYLDQKSEITSSGDLLLAARTFAAGHAVTFKRDVLVTGFSQGGAAGIAFAHALQDGKVGPFRLGALHAVAGPYDLVGTELPAAFDGRLLPATAAFYLAYLTTAWNRTVGLYDDPRDAFLPPYAQTVEGLFDGTHSPEEVSAGLPNDPAKLFTPAFLAKLKHPTGRFLAALRKADRVCDWKPDIPVHLYSGAADTDVAPANTNACAAALTRHGTHVTIHSMGQVDHNGTALAAYPQIIRTFAKAADRQH